MAAKRKKPATLGNRVRIIGGQWRGRKLEVGEEEGLRPTGDRVRETLFNWLMPTIVGANCLDAFAGTGALGFEALSRGARSVTFVEQNSNSANFLRTNIQLLCADACVHNQDFLSWKADTSNHFDLIFIDPPFAGEMWQQALTHMISHIPLPKDALIYIEAPREQNILLPPQWNVHREKIFGQVKALLCKTSPGEAG
ncbi:MAG: 16S rRNA (guanine(966)-N(2))-methyltransferase RsmD [Agarilytica sp.]